MKFAARHTRNPRRQRNKCSDHRQQPRNEHGHLSPAQKKTVGPIQLTASHENPASIALHQRTPAVAADLVSDQRPQIASDRARRRRPNQLHRTRVNQIPGKRHDQFRRQRDARRLNRHQQRNANITGRRDKRINEDEKYSEDFFGHRY